MAVVVNTFGTVEQLQAAIDAARLAGATVEGAITRVGASLADFEGGLMALDGSSTATSASGALVGRGSFAVTGSNLLSATKTITSLVYTDDSPAAQFTLGPFTASGPSPSAINSVSGTITSVGFQDADEAFQITGAIGAANLFHGTETGSITSFSITTGGVQASFTGSVTVTNGVWGGTITGVSLAYDGKIFAATGLNDGVALIDLDTLTAVTALAMVLDGNDAITGGAGSDAIAGGAGNDSIAGGEGIDGLNGEAGNDTLDGGGFRDNLAGGAGNDSLLGGADNDSLDGGDGNDTLQGGEGNDQLVGGAGNDVLMAGPGTYQSLFGGAGNDTFHVASWLDIVMDEGPGATDGVDLVIATLTSGFAYTLPTNVHPWFSGKIENLTLLGTGNIGGAGNEFDNVITGSATANNELNGFGGNDTLIGAGGNDFLGDGFGNNSLTGGAGNDTLGGAQAADTLAGGTGDDWFNVRITFFGAGTPPVSKVTDTGGIDWLHLNAAAAPFGGGPFPDIGYVLEATIEHVDLAGIESPFGVRLTANALNNTVLGRGGRDTLIGGGGNDSLAGLAEQDSLVGDAGNDTLDGGLQPDLFNGGAGNDLYILDDAIEFTQITDSGGIDTVLATIGGVTLGAGIENLILDADGTGTGNALNNVLTDGEGTVSLDGGNGNDTYNVQGDDQVTEDSILGAGTADLVNLTLGADEEYTLGANIENAQLISGAHGQQLTGNTSNNKLTGGAGNDYLDGGTGNDTLIGGAGDDQLRNSAGKDSLVGGLGNDVYYVDLVNLTAATLGIQDLVGAEALNAGSDTLVLMAGGGVAQNTTALAVTLGANLETLEFSGTTNPLRINATGNVLNNRINANGASSKLDGGAGNDSINGGAGNDTVLGAAGNDTLEGGEGNDSLDGGLGNDELQESFGDDVFVIAQAGDTLVEIEASSSVDTVRLGLATHALRDISGAAFIENLVYFGAGAVALTGNDGDNSLQGGAGADTLVGGLGNDTLGVGQLTDTVVGGGGTDTVFATIAYSIAAMGDVENLTLGGTANKATGNALGNVLTGNAAANTLDGGAGNDTMYGGNGADTYVVDSTDDQAIEATAGAAGGIDQVTTSVDFTLGANIENGTVTGSAGRALTGNDLANKLTGGAGNDSFSGGALNDTLAGNAGDDSLDGGTGNDSMAGGLGNDSYVVDSSLDKVSELAGQGTDTVFSSITYSIAAFAQVENLSLTGGGNFSATGNAGHNVLVGNAGSNSLAGGAGNDTLEGGAGNDSLDGGLGIGDIARYAGNQVDYAVASLGNGIYQVSSAAEGVDTLSGIERISFADASSLVLADSLTLVAALDAGPSMRLAGNGTITLHYSFMSAMPSYDPAHDEDSIQAPDAALQAAITAALQLWEDVANIDFVLADDDDTAPLFRFGTEVLPDPGDEFVSGYAYLPNATGPNGEGVEGDVWLNRGFFGYDDSATAGFAAGTPVFATLLHEIGHALGLKHPFEPPSVLPPATDNNLYTVMSYDPAPNGGILEVTETPTGWDFLVEAGVDVWTPMLYDVSTIQALYGANAATRSGDTTYGTNVADGGFAFGIGQPFFLTIWDGGGTDTIDVSHLALPSAVDLRPGAFSSIGMSEYLGIYTPEGEAALPFGLFPVDVDVSPWPPFPDLYDGTSNLAIAKAAVIENAIGGTGADLIVGNASANGLAGGGGNDTLTGGAGADRFIFDTAPDTAGNADRITDFTPGSDKIVLDVDVYAALEAGALPADAFTTGAFAAGDYVRYIASSGELWYDPAGDGAGGVAEIKFATLAGSPGTLAAGDFLIVA